MSFPSTTARVAYSGDGSTVEFSVTFPFQANADLAVVLTTSGVDTTQTLNTHYVVGGAGQDSGGTVRFTTAPAIGTTVTIFRDVDLNQERSFTYNGAFPTATVTLAVDKAMQAAQQLNEKLKRTFRISETNAEIAPLTVTQRAGKVTGFDATGAPTLYEPELPSLPTGAAYDVATIAELKALPAGAIPANKQIIVGGYNSPGDDGGGIFHYDAASTATENAITIFQPTSGTGRWVRQISGNIFPEMAGAYGNNVTDDAIPLQRAIDYCKSSKRNLYLKSKTYRTTRSLDGTYSATGLAGFWIIGEGSTASEIEGALVEAYPVLDMSGNTRGGIKDMAVAARSGQATCGVLSAKGSAGGGYGNVFSIDRCRVELYANTNGGTTDNAGVVLFNTDLSSIIDSEIYGPIACILGFVKPSAITSKFQVIPSNLDSTLLRLTRSVFNSWKGPAIDYTGGAAINMDSIYAAVIGSDSPGSIIRISGSGGKSIYAPNIRIENQSSSSVTLINFVDFSTAGEIGGGLEAESGDFVIDAPNGISRYKLSILSSVGQLFKNNTKLVSVDLFTNNDTVGTLSTDSFDLRVSAGASSIQSILNATSRGCYVYGAAFNARLGNDAYVSPFVKTMRGRYLANIYGNNLDTSSYVGGSGEQIGATFPLAAGVLTGFFNGATDRIGIQMRLRGYLDNGAGNTGGRIRIVLSQGATTATLLDCTSIPTGSGAFRIDTELSQISGPSYLSNYSEGIIKGTIYQRQFGTVSFDTTAAMDLVVYITNDSNAGVMLQHVMIAYI